MKQIVLCLIGILLASFVSAQKINHPSLLYTPLIPQHYYKIFFLST